jgi:hypothetical protein
VVGKHIKSSARWNPIYLRCAFPSDEASSSRCTNVVLRDVDHSFELSVSAAVANMFNGVICPRHNNELAKDPSFFKRDATMRERSIRTQRSSVPCMTTVGGDFSVTYERDFNFGAEPKTWA